VHGGGVITPSPSAPPHMASLTKRHRPSKSEVVHRRSDLFASLRSLVQGAIERHLPAEQFEVLKAAEASERDLIASLVANLSAGES
jgi:hypothetical protein